MADEKSRAYGAQGGRRRAALLSPEQRREIAMVAAEGRWGPLPKAVCGSADRPLRLGDIEIQCYVLDDDRRVLVQRGLQSGIGMSTSGGTGGAHRMARFIASLEGKGVKTKNLSVRMEKPILFRPEGLGKTAYGYEATILSDICRAVLEARRLGVLRPNQEKYAETCEILQGAFAEYGINALVDEVTGYRDLKQQHDIARFIQQYVAKDMRQWVRTFPRSFFEQLCRLRDIPFPEDMRLPQYIGHDINNLVWARLAPGVKDELRRRNPVVDGRRKHKHHQFLTENVGDPRLLHHLGRLEGIASGFGRGEFEKFKAKVNVELPSHVSLPLFSGIPEEPKPIRARKTPRAISKVSSVSSSPELSLPIS